MVWPRHDRQDGYATAAAITVSLALALVATAVVQASTGELRLARADLRRTQAEYLLAGAQTTATAAMLGSGQRERLRWSFSADGRTVEALAEPEAAKLDLKIATLNDGALARFDLPDATRAKARLRAAAGGQGARDAIREASSSPLWRACALSALSRYGRAPTLTVSAAAELQSVPGAVAWRAGEVWRVRVSADGWTDDRIVRFTGDPGHPAAVVERNFSRGEARGEPCQALIGADAKP